MANVLIQVPVADASNANYLPWRVEFGVDDGCAVAMQRVTDGLRNINATLANGKPVSEVRDAVVWLAQHCIAEATGSATEGEPFVVSGEAPT